MSKRILTICLVAVMTLSLLAGCGKKQEEPKKEKEITTVQELLDANKKASKDVQSVSVKGNGNFELKTGSEETGEMSAPAKFEFTADASKKIVHATGNAEISMFGQTQKVAPELYIDIENKKVYSKMSEEEKWTAASTDLDTSSVKEMKIPQSIMDQLTLSEEDGSYVIKSDLSKIDVKQLLKDLSEEQEDMDEYLESIEKTDVSIESGEFVAQYSKDTCLLEKVEIKGFSGKGSSEISKDQKVNYSATLDLSFAFSNYNKVPAENLEIPEEALAAEVDE